MINEPLAPARTPTLSLSITADKVLAAVNEPITITARLLMSGTETVAPVDQSFAVPIEDESGKVVRIKGVQFVQGVATVPLSFPASGYYRLTEAGVNRDLPAEQRIALPAEFMVTVYE